jgi:alpha-L-rhamnosidase
MSQQSVQWNAAMISPVDDHDGAPLLRTEVTLDEGHGEVTDARLHVSSLGVHEVTVDGSPVADDVLSPGWSSYEWRIRYRSHDVTPLLAGRSAPVVLGILLGNGWYRGRLTWSGQRAL